VIMQFSSMFCVPEHSEKKFYFDVPLNATAFQKCIAKLDKADPLGCDEYMSMRELLTRNERLWMAQAVNKMYVAYDHCEVVTEFSSGVLSIYLARGRPDKWHPWTKSDHRRVLRRGCWAAPVPTDDSPEAFWHARRQLCLVEALDKDDDTDVPPLPKSSRLGSEESVGPSAVGGGFGKGSDMKGSANVYVYRDPSYVSAADDMSPADRVPAMPRPAQTYDPRAAETLGMWPEGTHRVPLSGLALLNQHLGKAGGLNFGLEALMMVAGLELPAMNRPMIFGIVDARHAVDERFWVNVLPAFHEMHGNSLELVKYEPEVALCQLAHSYIGMKHETDKLDINNNFLFTGMAFVRDRCYGMTSCGTGGIWAITSPDNAGSYFFGRTMIEDTSSSHVAFLAGRRSVYIPPKRNNKFQLMTAVPKVSANYLEALERWDTGAIQVFIALALGFKWFWMTFGGMLILCFAVVAPTFCTGPTPILNVIEQPFHEDHFYDAIVYMFSLGTLSCLFFTTMWLSLYSPRILNSNLRNLIMLFNCIYPFNTIATIFWLIVPPWLCIAGAFPFRLNAISATIGGLILKYIEFAIVSKMKKDSEMNGSELDDMSIQRSQQMDKVTVPIKLRAIYKGIITGRADVVGKKDNSFWESFGTPVAAGWVQMWLLSIWASMIVAIIAGIVRIWHVLIYGPDVLDVVLPCGFGMINAVVVMWATFDPLAYVLADKGPRLSLRYVEVVVMLSLAFVTFSVLMSSPT